MRTTTFIISLILLILAGCKGPYVSSQTNVTGKRLAAASGHIANIRFYASRIKPKDVQLAVAHDAEAAEVAVMEADLASDQDKAAISSLTNEVIRKTQDLVVEHGENQWLGWKLRRIWFWIKVTLGLGFVATLIFANALPSSFLWKPLSCVVSFVASVPGRVVRLFRPPPPVEGGS